MQFQSDISDLCIERPLELESTARGAALLAGVGAGLFSSVSQVATVVEHPERFESQMTETARREHTRSWQDAVRRTRSIIGAEQRVRQDVH